MNKVAVRNSIEAFFRQRASIKLPTSCGNLYELYAYVCVCRSVHRIGRLASHGVASGEFRFRCSPGSISPDFSYFACRQLPNTSSKGWGSLSESPGAPAARPS